MGAYVNITNKEYGNWTVIKVADFKSKRGELYWICKCKCGTIKAVLGSGLRGGYNKGCRQCGNDKVYKGYYDLSGTYWKIIQHSAKGRNLEFNLTIEYVWRLFVNQNKRCLLTGRPIILLRKFSDKISKNWLLQTASLDRINSKIGYVVDNVCWLHKDVNMFKGSMHNKDFIALCQEVTNYQKALDTPHAIC
jgi:hypothetical protein